jgi:hypothetical protein
MSYYNRANQLYNTLGSFDYHYRDRHDYEVVIAVDVKTINDEQEYNSFKTVVNIFNINMNIKVVETNYENCWNPAPLLCDAVDNSSGEFLILTNPEVMHKSDIMNALDWEFTKDRDTYVVCACENVKIDKYYENVTDINTFEYEHIQWYQHSEHRNLMLHFCTAISRDQYDNIGGFDRRYMHGAGVEDVDFIFKIQEWGSPIVVRDDLVTLHQDHKLVKNYIPDHSRLWDINKNLFSAIHGQCV